MNYRYSENTIDSITRSHLVFIIAGVVFLLLPFAMPSEVKVGFLIGYSLLSLGIYAVALKKWRTEPGLWMLAVLLIVLLGAVYGFFAYDRYTSEWGLVNLPEEKRFFSKVVFLPLEVIVSFSICWTHIRFAYSVALSNWERTRSR